MIQANELRLGNRVCFHNDNTIFEVMEIGPAGLSVADEIEETWIELDGFSGVELTPEILTKCGFQQSGDCWQLNNVFLWEWGITLVSYHLDRITAGDTSLEVKYLHQLQNLHFALTGKELEINL